MKNTISITRGDNLTLKVSLNGPDGDTIPFEGGDRLFFTVKESINIKAYKIQKEITEFDNDTATIEIVPDDTKDLKFMDYVYDIELHRNNVVKTIVKPDTFKVMGEVTWS